MFNYSFANSIKLIYFVVLYYTRSIYYLSTINIIIEIILMLLMATLLPLKKLGNWVVNVYMAFVNEFAKDNNKRRINMEENNLSDNDSSGKWILGGNG